MEAKERLKLKRLINEVRDKRGRHTELVTLYVPQGYDLNNVLTQLAQEQGTATNIKSKTTRKNVVDALEKTIQHLRLFKRTPANGLVVFCGNVSEKEGQQDLQLWSIEPPEPINIKVYQCDQRFLVEHLEALVLPKDIYGLITIDNKTATIATLKGSRYRIIKSLKNHYHGKHRAGGQSHRRFERLIAEESHNFKKKAGNYANQAFLPDIKNVRGLIIGGPAYTKEDFIAGDYLNHELKKKILGTKDITYTDESGIRELVDISQDLLQEVEMVEHKKLIQKFLKVLVSDERSVAYGGGDIQKALDTGAVKVLLLSENLPEKEVDRLYEEANRTGAEVKLISVDFEEGFQLWNTFGGKAALLRFQL